MHWGLPSVQELFLAHCGPQPHVTRCWDISLVKYPIGASLSATLPWTPAFGHCQREGTEPDKHFGMAYFRWSHRWY